METWKNVNYEKLQIILHLIAGIILLAYSFSHFGFLTLNDMNLAFYNTVFPFLTNSRLFLTVGVIELLVGSFCIRYRGNAVVNLLILTFIAVILWYRWAFFYTGGKSCSCMGLVGRLFHVNRFHEEAISIGTLILLGLTTLPWLWHQLRILKQRYCARLAVVIVFSGLSALSTANADETIKITGTVDLQDYNPGTGQPYPQQHSSGVFLVKMCGNTWMFSVTNIDRPAWWISFVYDGTNGFTIGPAGGKFFSENAPSTNEDQAIIMGSMLYQPFLSDPLGASICWLTYGISADTIKYNKRGIVCLPLPWHHPRNTPGGYGYRWVLNFGPNERFISDCTIIRDKSLDLDEKAELFRDAIDYPDTPEDYDTYKASLLDRKSQPDGFVDATYKVTQWRRVNGISIPTASELDVNLNPQRIEHPWRVINLKTFDVSLDKRAEPMLQNIKTRTIVEDYRYKKFNSSRIFKYAKYTLVTGDSWRSNNDPILMAEADYWLKHGRKYTIWEGAPERYTAWLVLAVLFSPVIVFTICSVVKKKQHTKTHI